jgi:hypothetical protein
MISSIFPSYGQPGQQKPDGTIAETLVVMVRKGAKIVFRPELFKRGIS